MAKNGQDLNELTSEHEMSSRILRSWFDLRDIGIIDAA
jgi:hypothetical protein